MADAVSKLYAEIGFKVNQQELNNAKAYIRDIAKQLSDFNKQAQVAAEKAGFFSKKQIQQQRAQNREIEHQNKLKISEQLKQNREQEKLYKEITDIENREYKEQLRQADVQERERQKRREEVLKNMKSFGTAFWKLSQLIGAKAGQAIGESVGRATDFSKLQMFTGISSSDFRSFVGRAYATNSGMSQQDVMRDIQNVSANIQKIALGQGSLSGYKLMHRAARRGDIAGVIREFEDALQTISPDTALEVGQQIGLSRDWIYSLLQKRRGGGAEIEISQKQYDEITETGKAFAQVRYEVENFKDSITATLSPALQQGADGLRRVLKSITKHFQENQEYYNELIEKYAKRLEEYFNSLKKEDVEKFVESVETVTKALVEFASGISTIIEWILWPFKLEKWIKDKLNSSGNVIDTNDPKEALKHAMLGDSPWTYGLKPETTKGDNVFSQANEINVTVESKSDNPHEVGEVIGNTVASVSSEKASFAYNSTYMAGYNRG